MSTLVPLQSTRLRLIIALSALAVLIVGYLVRPQIELPPPAVEEQPSPILREVVQRREVQNVFAALQQTARMVLPPTARLTPATPEIERWSDFQPDPPVDHARFAVAVGESRLLGDAADLPAGATVQVHVGDGRTVAGLVMAHFEDARLALIALDGGAPLAVPNPAPALVAPGDVVVGVAPGETDLVAVPMVVAEVRSDGLDVTANLERYLGMPVFTAAGDWVGLVAAGPNGMRVVRADDVLNVAPVEKPETRPLGLSLRYATDSAEAATAPRRIVVDDVAPEGVAERAGLRTADSILTIGGEAPPDLPAAVAALTTARTAPLPIRVRRGNRAVTVRLPAEEDAR